MHTYSDCSYPDALCPDKTCKLCKSHTDMVKRHKRDDFNLRINRLCTACKEVKPHAEFPPSMHKTSVVPSHFKCHDCMELTRKEWVTFTMWGVEEKFHISTGDRTRRYHGVDTRWRKSECPNENCYWCGTLLTDRAMVRIDHIQPHHDRGSDEEFNLAPTCIGCNAEKSGKSPLVWLAELVSVPEGLTAREWRKLSAV